MLLMPVYMVVEQGGRRWSHAEVRVTLKAPSNGADSPETLTDHLLGLGGDASPCAAVKRPGCASKEFATPLSAGVATSRTARTSSLGATAPAAAVPTAGAAAACGACDRSAAGGVTTGDADFGLRMGISKGLLASVVECPPTLEGCRGAVTDADCDVAGWATASLSPHAEPGFAWLSAKGDVGMLWALAETVGAVTETVMSLLLTEVKPCRVQSE